MAYLRSQVSGGAAPMAYAALGFYSTSIRLARLEQPPLISPKTSLPPEPATKTNHLKSISETTSHSSKLSTTDKRQLPIISPSRAADPALLDDSHAVMVAAFIRETEADRCRRDHIAAAYAAEQSRLTPRLRKSYPPTFYAARQYTAAGQPRF